MKNVTDYLTEDFKHRKEMNPSFSLRSYARWLEISPAQLSQVLSRKRVMGAKGLKKVVVKLKLSPAEEKTLYSQIGIQKMLKGRLHQQEKVNLEEDKFRIISDWYHFAILALSRIEKMPSSISKLSKWLEVPASKVKEALERLERLSIIEQTPYLKQTSKDLEVVSSVPSPAIQKYHKQNMLKAIDALENTHLSKREFQSIYINLKKDQVKELKSLIDDFLENAQTQENNQNDSDVYALNVQLFPLTNKDN